MLRLQNFWRRVTEGLELSQLWSQFESEARASYRLYSRDVEAKTPEGLTNRGRHLHVLKEFFWAVFEKLSRATGVPPIRKETGMTMLNTFRKVGITTKD